MSDVSWYMKQDEAGLFGIQHKCTIIMEWSLYITQDESHEPCRFTHKDYLTARVWLHERLGQDILGYETALGLFQCCENRIHQLEDEGLMAVMKCQSHPSVADKGKVHSEDLMDRYHELDDVPF